MIVHKMWRVHGKPHTRDVFWDREGWFLFGIIPLFVRTTHHRVREWA